MLSSSSALRTIYSSCQRSTSCRYIIVHTLLLSIPLSPFFRPFLLCYRAPQHLTIPLRHHHCHRPCHPHTLTSFKSLYIYYIYKILFFTFSLQTFCGNWFGRTRRFVPFLHHNFHLLYT